MCRHCHSSHAGDINYFEGDGKLPYGRNYLTLKSQALPFPLLLVLIEIGFSCFMKHRRDVLNSYDILNEISWLLFSIFVNQQDVGVCMFQRDGVESLFTTYLKKYKLELSSKIQQAYSHVTTLTSMNH